MYPDDGLPDTVKITKISQVQTFVYLILYDSRHVPINMSIHEGDTYNTTVLALLRNTLLSAYHLTAAARTWLSMFEPSSVSSFGFML